MEWEVKETANTFHISRNTVRKYVRLFISSGKPTEQLLEFTEEQLRDMFGCTEFRRREPSQRQLELDALIPDYVARLSRKGMTVRKLFNEYREDHPDGFQESVFKRAVRQYRFHTTVIGHVEHYAADQMYIDFAGDRLTVVDEMTGEVKKAEVFVAILPFSHYTYCEAVWSQRKEDLIKACQNAFHYFEGVVAAIVPDNLKAAVKTSDRNEPVINEEFAAFAEHYGCAVYPARVRHPKDKALVENAVKLLYRSVYLDIEGMVFTSLDELNTAIHISLLDFNEKPMAGRDMSRRDMFLLRGEGLPPSPARETVCHEGMQTDDCRQELLRISVQAPLQRSPRTCGQACGHSLRCRHRGDILRSEPRGDARQMRHPLYILMEEGTQSARSLRSLRQGSRGTLPTCCGDGQHRSGLPARSGRQDAVPAKILQQLPWDTVAREKIRNRPAHSGMRMRIAEI